MSTSSLPGAVARRDGLRSAIEDAKLSPVETATTALDDAAMDALAADAKIALVATLDAEGLPHLTLLTSLQARGPRELTFGQFSEGLSKDHLRADPRAAFVVMTKDRRIWTGKARWTHEAKKGEDHEAYNRKPMFRYNAYFGIHTVHYLDLVEVRGPEIPSTASLLAGVLAASLAGRGGGGNSGERILTAWAERLLASPRTLKFLAWAGSDGYPEIRALVPGRSAGSRRLVIAGAGRGPAAGSVCAVYGLNLQMESVMVRGVLSAPKRTLGLGYATLEIDHVYNSMPPNHGVIHPPKDIGSSAGPRN